MKKKLNCIKNFFTRNVIEAGVLLLLVLALLSVLIDNCIKIYDKDTIQYSVKSNPINEISVIKGNYNFTLVPADNNMIEYQIYINEITKETKGNIEYLIMDENGKDLFGGNLDIEEIKSNKLISIPISEIELKKDKPYILNFKNDIEGEIKLQVNEKNELYHNQIFENHYKNIYYSVCAVLIVILGMLLFFVFAYKRNSLKKIMIFFASIGILAVFIIPPYTAPDELRHFVRAYTISRGEIICKQYVTSEEFYNRTLPVCDIEKEIVNLKLIGTESGEHWTSETNYHIFLPKWLDSVRAKQLGEKETIPYPATATINPIAYLPQVIFIWLARILQFNALGIFYMARLGNVCFCMGLLYLSIKILPDLKNYFILLSFAPGMVFLRSTCSTDGFLFGIVLLFLAQVIKIGKTKESLFDNYNYLILSILLLIIALIKLPYLLCVGVLFLLDNQQFTSSRKRSSNFLHKLRTMTLIIGFVIACYLLSDKILTYIKVEDGTSSIFYIQYLLAHPFRIISLITKTTLNTFVDDINSALSLPSSKGLILPYLFILIYFGLCKSRDEIWIEKNQKNKYLIFWGCLMWGAIIGTFYFLGPAPDIGYIWGVQGRYLYPIFPIIGLGFLYGLDSNSLIKRTYNDKFLIYSLLITAIHLFNIMGHYWL